MYKQIKIRILLLFTLLLVCLIVFSSVKTFQQSIFSKNSVYTSASNNYLENFDSPTYLDDSNTTAYGWDFGNVTLPDKNITLSRIEGIGEDIFIVGDIAYIGGYRLLYIYNISDPSNPHLMGYNTSFSIPIRGIYVDGDYLFAAAYSAGLAIFDVSDPANIKFVTLFYNYDVDGGSVLWDYHWAYHVWAIPSGSGTSWYVYLFDDAHGFVSFIFTEPNLVIHTGGYDPGPNDLVINTENGNLFIQDDIAYCSYGNLMMIDISDRTNPVHINTYTPDDIDRMFLLGDLIYYEDYNSPESSYFKILNISDPYSPNPVYSSEVLTHSMSSIAVSNGYAYLGYSLEVDTDTFAGFFNVYNVSDPSNAHLIYTYASPFDHVLAAYWLGVYVIEAVGNYAYMFDRQFFIIDISLIDKYESEAIAQSTEIYSSAYNTLYNATLSATTSIPPSCDISYYLSPDNGMHWEQVYLDTPHIFTNIGGSLKWKANLSTSDPYITPAIYSISISYTTILNKVNLTTPTDSSLISDNTPYFEWTTIPGAMSFLLQLDTSPSFSSSSPDFLEIEVIDYNYHTLITPLHDDEWYWRVVAIDGDGDIGVFSDIFMFTLDGPPGTPSLNSLQNNAFTNDDTPLLSWSSAVDAYNYTLQIDTSISFTSMDLLEIGGLSSTDYVIPSSLSETMWYWRVCAYDDFNNQGSYSTIFHFTVDTTLPTIDHPSDLEINRGTTGTQIEWNPDDLNPSSCIVTKNGDEIYNEVWTGGTIGIDVDSSTIGTYEYNCIVYDKAGNSISDSVTVQVLQVGTTGPAIPGYPFYLIIGYISLGSVITIQFIKRKIKISK